jgi:outer membrane protein OmpA-like peptidoglycan-associated protein
MRKIVADNKIGILFFLIFSSTLCHSQNNSENLLKEAKESAKKALEVGANIFAKSNYEKGADYYKDAESALKDGKSLDDINGKLLQAIDYYKKATETANLMNINFIDLMKIRQLAIDAGAYENFPKLWNEAEDNFSDAADEYNDKNIEKVKKYSNAATENYKLAELNGLKYRYMNDLHTAITKAEDNNLQKSTPVTLKKSKQLAQEAENILDANRYDTLNARNTVTQSLYDLNHGLYMQSLFKKMNEQEKTWEDLVLSWEEPLIKISSEYKLNALFDNGYENITSQIISKIHDERTKTALVGKETLKLNTDIEELKKSIEEYKTKMIALEDENAKYKNQFAESEKNAQLIESVSTMFLPSEAEIVRNGDLIIVRLTNFIFPANKSSIDPQYFSLLTKVQKAIQTFPNCTVVIEGHTDSQGDNKKNITLSQARADAVFQYLMANMGMDISRISSIGYGAAKPIANNATEEGRTRNKRIEIVINPHVISVK